MKSWLVDVPVRIKIWIRPECQRKQFEVLKEARPSIMFLISDGGRNEIEWEAIKLNRKMFDTEVDWDCTIYRLYEDKNNGLYSVGKKSSKLIWDNVDRCILLEDDDVPSVCFFRFCAELLEKYKDDTRIYGICGMNQLGVSKKVSSDYFFAIDGSVWGTATWKRVYELRENLFDYGKDEYTFNLLKKACKKDKFFKKKLIGYTKDEFHDGHIAAGEFYNHFNAYGFNMLRIIPKYNMMCNLGATANSTHSTVEKLMPKAIRKLYNMKTYEYEFPLKHPKFIIPDDEYTNEIDKILAQNRPIRAFARCFEIAFLIFKHKGIKGVLNKIKKFVLKGNRKNIET